MRNGILITILVLWNATGQTQIDLRTQAKNVDFSAASSTKPLKTGTSLPPACAAGEVFFNISAPAGANLYACTTANTWAAQGGINSQNCWADAGTKLLKCQDGQENVYVVVQTATTATPNQWVDYINPSGVPHTSQPTAAAVGAIADPGSNGIPYRNGFGTAVTATADQMSGPLFCQDAGTSSAYQCDLQPAISGYSTGSTYWFKANTANTGAATINFNGLGARKITKQINQTLAAGDIKTGQWVMVTYDGTNMQMQSQTGAAQVAAVYGRTGSIVAQSGDYSAAQVTNAVDQTGNYANPNWIASLPWGKLTGIPSTFTPTPHAGTHSAAGADAISLDASQIVSGTLNLSLLPGSAMQSNQSNAVTAGTQDFSGADHTLPMKSGTLAARPSSCTVGENYFAVDAAPGNNIYGCTGPNTWTPEGANGLTVANGGATIGSRGAINLIPGQGITTVMTDTGSQINVQLALDSAVISTQPEEQSGSSLMCASHGGSATTYTCSMTPTLTTYTIGQTVNWIPDVSGTGGATTLNLDTLGATPVVQSDGVTTPTSTSIVAGHLYSVWYDGASFRLPATSILVPVTISTSGPVTVTATGFYYNNASAGLTYLLPAITSRNIGAQFCFRNSPAKTGPITLQSPAGTYIDNGGINGSAAGTFISSGTLGDAACVVAASPTQYAAYPSSGGWVNN